MPRIHLEADISLATLVHTAAQLPPEDLRHLTAQLLALRAQRTAPSVSQEEAELLEAINRRLPEDIQRSYETLRQQRDNETLSAVDYQELLRLTQVLEAFDVARVDALTRLAALRGVTLATLMDQLDLADLADA